MDIKEFALIQLRLISKKDRQAPILFSLVLKT